MEITKRHKLDLLGLKARIKGLAEEIRRTRQLKKQAVSVYQKNRYAMFEDTLSREARYHLIAYGLLRGKSYSEIENSPNREKLKYDFNYAFLVEILHRYSWSFDRRKLTVAALKSALMGTITQGVAA